MAKKKKTRRLKRGSVLVTLGVIFAVSVVLRLGTMELEFVTPASASDPEPLPSVMGPTSPLRAAMDEVTMLRDRLAAREAELDDRERAVDVAQVLIDERLATLEAAEQRLQALIQVSDTAAEGDLARLTEVYETMGPDQTAALFTQMDPNFAAGFLTRMSPAASAAIMSELDPANAYAISVVIATRNASAPTLEDPDVEPDTDTDS
jgi:flagellar motility protein MotE (MotC chaperone)